MKKSPSKRSLEYLEARGFLVDNVERWIPRTKIRKDLFGFADLLAIKPGRTVAVQTTDASNFSKRVNKVLDCTGAAVAVKAGWIVEVHGWRKEGAEPRLYQIHALDGNLHSSEVRNANER